MKCILPSHKFIIIHSRTLAPSELIFPFVCCCSEQKQLCFEPGGLASKLWSMSPPAPLRIKDTRVFERHSFALSGVWSLKPIPCVVFSNALCQIIWWKKPPNKHVFFSGLKAAVSPSSHQLTIRVLLNKTTHTVMMLKLKKIHVVSILEILFGCITLITGVLLQYRAWEYLCMCGDIKTSNILF